MFRSLPFKPFFLCGLPDSGILSERCQSLQQRMFLLDRASQSASPWRAGSPSYHRGFVEISPRYRVNCSVVSQCSVSQELGLYPLYFSMTCLSLVTLSSANITPIYRHASAIAINRDGTQKANEV